jgi:hypothetical protein
VCHGRQIRPILARANIKPLTRRAVALRALGYRSVVPGPFRESLFHGRPVFKFIGNYVTHAVCSSHRRLTIARYTAAITRELHHATGRSRGGIPGRWTKPVAMPRICAAASEDRSLSRTQLGELYLASTGAASVASSSRERTRSGDQIPWQRIIS